METSPPAGSPRASLDVSSPPIVWASAIIAAHGQELAMVIMETLRDRTERRHLARGTRPDPETCCDSALVIPSEYYHELPENFLDATFFFRSIP